MQRNNCLLGGIQRFPKWTTYSTPSERVVCYSVLLRRKREFQQFIDQLENQVSIRNRISSCYIIDKIHSTADRNNMNIYIFDSNEYYKSLQLTISIPKKYFKKKIHLLTHLSSKNNAVSKLEDRCMYIKCKESKIWKTFYSFFEFLFQKSSENIIGVQFYTSLICKCLIAKELSFLLSLSSRCVNIKTLDMTSISKPSSLCALIKECPKNSIKPIELHKQRIASMQTMLQLQVKQTPSPSMTLKRKPINSENDSRVKTLKVGHDFCKKFICQCHERTRWKFFKQVHNQPTINYTEILEAEGLLDTSELSQILSSQPEKSNSFNTLKAHQNSASNENIFSKLGCSKDIEFLLKSSYQIMDAPVKMDLGKAENLSIPNEFEQFGKLIITKTDHKLISHNPNEETESDNSVRHCKTNTFTSCNKNIYSQAKVEYINKKYIDSSNTLIKDECKAMTVPPEDFKLPSESNSNLLHDVSSVGFQAASSKECKSTCKWQIESQNTQVNKSIIPTASFQPVSVTHQPMGFLTAAGKSLNVSEKAIFAAQKMFAEVCSQEIDELVDMAGDGILPNTSVSKKPVYPFENSIENEFNSDLADKFFEEMPFDDKEVESKQKENTALVTNSNSVKPQVGKVRKSLGGRRCLKPYSLEK